MAVQVDSRCLVQRTGQAKRTNIGLALVSQPRVLFLDEPTSGKRIFHEPNMLKLEPDNFDSCAGNFLVGRASSLRLLYLIFSAMEGVTKGDNAKQ